MLDVRCSQGFMGENSPKTSRIEPMNRRKTSNTQHPTSNNQWFPIGPLIGGWVLDVGCSVFPRVHGEVRGGFVVPMRGQKTVEAPANHFAKIGNFALTPRGG